MRGYDAVFGMEQRVIRQDRLNGDDIHRCTADFPAVKGVGNILFIQYGSATGVDKNYPIFHLCNAFFIYESHELRGQRGVQGDEVRLA